ncbi:MAG: ABC transporter permease subunit [Candidatus Aenigmarchaeota archaeon]|nr:ABC transporter permease subunit [Candidatus Aenigmarchaeota archaeon]
MSEILGIYTVWLREMIRYFRQKERIISSLTMPIFWLLIFGGSMRTSIDIGSVDYNSFIAPGVVAMSILFTSIMSGISVIWDKELGFMKEMLVSPVSRFSIVLGKALGTATTAVIQGTMVMLISLIVGLEISFVTFISVIPLMVLISLGLVGIGISIASLMDNIEGFQLIMNFIVMPMFFLSGALFPINNLPSVLRVVTYVDPLTYGVETLRYTIIGVSNIPFGISLSVVIGFSLLTLSVSAWLFSRRK